LFAHTSPTALQFALQQGRENDRIFLGELARRTAIASFVGRYSYFLVVLIIDLKEGHVLTRIIIFLLVHIKRNALASSWFCTRALTLNGIRSEEQWAIFECDFHVLL